MNKVVKDGKVAVLYTSKHGAGWSTWASRDHDLMVFCPEVVQYILDHGNAGLAEFVENSATLQATGNYLGGAENLAIEWIPKGNQFEITVYDGRESVEDYGPSSLYTA